MAEEAPYGPDEWEEPVRVEVVAGRGSRVEVDGELMAIWFGVGVCIYDKLVLDESGQWMCW